MRWSEAAAALRSRLVYDGPQAAVLDPRGHTVRCTPRRRTVRHRIGGEILFRKLRHGGRRAAAHEWQWLHHLPRLGFRTPQPLLFASAGRDSVLVTAAAPGRPLDAQLGEVLAAGTAAARRAAVQYACGVVAPLVRRLHDLGLVYRDLYWNHLFASGLRVDGDAPVLIDVERVMRLRWRVFRQRWRTKDLAGLLASLPQACHRPWPPAQQLDVQPLPGVELMPEARSLLQRKERPRQQQQQPPPQQQPQQQRQQGQQQRSEPQPASFSRTDRLRFLRSYAGGLHAGWKPLARAIVRKAERIRRHQPKYG